jgi:hypothetical protein
VTNSRAKGARGELEASKEAANHWFASECYRTAQRDGKETADISKALPGAHVEVKRRKKIAATHFMDQAIRDKAEEEFPVVLMRQDRGDWLVMIRLEDTLRFVRGYLKNRQEVWHE